MLKEILAHVRKLQSPAYIAADDEKDFCMNIVANVVASFLEKDEKSVSVIKEKFNL